jgi:L-lysine exporter family protein LysE/ArgO
MFSVALKGFLLGASLIIAIGMQNAFILRQGLKNRYVFVAALTASLIDAALIVIGVMGQGFILKIVPALAFYIKWAGAAFLLAYGIRSFLKALRHDVLSQNSAKDTQSVQETLGVILALSLLNPHVYLDTVILLGSVGAAYQDELRYAFILGAMTASFAWFFSLAYGARFLSPFFAKPRAWQILDIIIGIVMCGIAFSLVAPEIMSP